MVGVDMIGGSAASSGGELMAAPECIRAWVEADRRMDLARMQDQLDPAVVLISPLTHGFDFRGREEVMAVFESAFELLTDVEIFRVTGAGSDWVLYGKNRLGGRNLEEIQWLRVGESGLIEEITLFIRPVPAAVSLLAKIGVPLHRRGTMNRLGAVASAMAAPLAAVLHLTEKHLMPRLKGR
ncbi:MAG TPA: nuclear transport factor 2 family protein [Actinomycetales bacterium]|nr:nuclear transport factor 2 family protein [Actinomycetales bacterium]